MSVPAVQHTEELFELGVRELAGRKLGQFVAGVFGELGVGLQELDRPRDLVDDALTGTVSRTEEFEVLDSIVHPVAVNMVDSFGVCELPADVLLHDISMLVDVVSPDTVLAGKSEEHVASHDSTRHGTLGAWAGLFVGSNQLLALKLSAAGIAASLCAAKTVTFSCELGAADFASTSALASSSNMRALSRTVHRVFAKLPMVFRKLSGFTFKWFVASFAVEDGRLDNVCLATMNRFVAFVAGEAAEFSLYFARKTQAALKAVDNSHWSALPVNTRRYVSHAGSCMSTANLIGAL